ncbi:hypothetical protein EYF80_045400 [Liparis tanakae]|uniref:Uncharacterized protein n=1 Tax=Liparis tanakae TaxID=230148 RepID=A0A4Z2FT34_9TELE|nr:hypothetical protein EYF80_045400 [Liparis tanakae]
MEKKSAGETAVFLRAGEGELKYLNFGNKIRPKPSCESQSELSCSSIGECNCCSSGAEETFRQEVKVPDLGEPPGDVMY